jgi:hypothetical protein
MALEHCTHWLHLEPTTLAALGAYYTGCTWSLLHWLHLEPTTLAALGAVKPPAVVLLSALATLKAVISPVGSAMSSMKYRYA